MLEGSSSEGGGSVASVKRRRRRQKRVKSRQERLHAALFPRPPRYSHVLLANGLLFKLSRGDRNRERRGRGVIHPQRPIRMIGGRPARFSVWPSLLQYHRALAALSDEFVVARFVWEHSRAWRTTVLWWGREYNVSSYQLRLDDELGWLTATAVVRQLRKFVVGGHAVDDGELPRYVEPRFARLKP